MIGILGGTFDPIHYGHLRTALDVQQRLSLDEVRFIPCGEPAHRNAPIAEPLQRLAMVRAAIAGQARFTADDREIRRDGPSYMVDTLISLKQDFKTEPLSLILGTDAFNGLAQWYQWQKIFDLANIVVMQRPARKGQVELNKRLMAQLKHRFVDADNLKTRQNGGICFVPVTQLDISATKIRQQWQQNKDIQFLLPDSVLTLIQQQNIY
ncbi:MAG: nicotinate-nucleotide adenylyltransferase [Gammaproteobacteria bacterium]|nr:nicotinate-nucleotide adenylyltransferase [Gammaproteobacteria bacterium]